MILAVSKKHFWLLRMKKGKGKKGKGKKGKGQCS